MTDTASEPNYQDILDKYADSIKSTEAPPTLKPEPELESTPKPEPLLDSELTPESKLEIDPKPENATPVNPQPIPEIEVQPKSEPEVEIKPQSEIEVKPQPEITPEPLNLTTPPAPEAITTPETPMELPPESSDLVPPKENHFFKYLFFFSLFVFIIVLVSINFSFINSQKSLSDTKNPPTNSSPTLAPVGVCEVNGQTYTVGESFPATDGCNSCSCDENLQIACTAMSCEPTKSATTSAIPKDWKTYSNKIYNISFQYPNTFSISDELPKTKTQGGPKTALELTDSKNNYQISIIIDPAGFGPIFADKKITLDYSPSNGLFSTKVIPSSEEDNNYLSQDKKTLWYEFDNNSLSNLTIITNATKADTKLEILTAQILFSFKFL